MEIIINAKTVGKFIAFVVAFFTIIPMIVYFIFYVGRRYERHMILTQLAIELQDQTDGQKTGKQSIKIKPIKLHR